MTEEVQPKKSFFKELVIFIKKWFNSDKLIQYNLTFEDIVKSFAVIIPVHGILYLYFYYSKFGTQYFLYFNPVDFLNVFYANNITLLVFTISLSFVLLYLLINIKSNTFLNDRPNILLFISYLAILLLLFIIRLYIPFMPFRIIFYMCTVVFILTILHREVRLLYYSIVVFYFLYTIRIANDNALIVKTTKPNFTILLNDNSYALKQDTINRKDYFIGKVTDYVFVYSDSIKAVRVIPVGDIKEIQFPLGK